MTYRTEKDVARIIETYGWANGNRELIQKFDNERKALKTAVTTRSIFVCSMKRVDLILRKPFKKIGRGDLTTFFAKRADQKSNAEKKCIKVFFQWLHGYPKGEYPPCVGWVGFGKQRQKLPEEMLTREDVLKLIKGAQTVRDKAIISMLYDSGCRASELCDIQLMHVKFDAIERGAREDGMVVEWMPVLLNGKTGQRQVYLQDSLPFLRQWMNLHPDPQNPRAFLFIGRPKQKLSGPNVLGQILDRAVKRSNLTKKVYPHIFRHSRATELAKNMTEAELKMWFGWSGSSRMPSTYTHLSGANMLEKLKKMGGITKTTAEKDLLAPLKCVKCGEVNLAGSKFCHRDGTPLDIDQILEEREKQHRREEFLDKLITMSERGDKDWTALKKELFG